MMFASIPLMYGDTTGGTGGGDTPGHAPGQAPGCGDTAGGAVPAGSACSGLAETPS